MQRIAIPVPLKKARLKLTGPHLQKLFNSLVQKHKLVVKTVQLNFTVFINLTR